MRRIILRLGILFVLADMISARDDSLLMSAVTDATGPVFLGRGCPSEGDLTAYGRRTVFDGIEIEGSPSFVVRTVIALNHVRHLETYRYALALDRIVENPRGPWLAAAWIRHGSRTANVKPSAARYGCGLYASVLLHEAAHAAGAREFGAYRVQARVLRELGLPVQAFVCDLQAFIM